MPLLAETTRRIDALVADAQAYGQAPSLCAGVVREGALVYHAGAGQLPAPDAGVQYRIGSISKTFTAALVLRLRDAGRLDLDDPLHRHLPGAPLGGATVRSLLGHASGLQREPDGEWWERAPGMHADQLLDGVSAAKVTGPAGSYHYSNLAYALLGAVAARLCDAPWIDLVTAQLLDPLGMARTTYHPEEPFARGYVVHPWHGTLREEPRHDSGAMAPAGQLWSTVTDLARWAAFLVSPAPGVLAASTVTEMCTPVVIADPQAWTTGQGLGLQLWRRGERVYAGHTGSMPGYLSVLAVHRTSGTGVVAVTNTYGLRRQGAGGAPGSIQRLGLDLLDTVVAAEAPPRPAWRPGAAPPPGVEALTGRWWWMGEEYEATWDSTARHLVVARSGDPAAVAWRFAPRGEDCWLGRSGFNAGETLSVRRGRSGAVTALEVAGCVFTRDPWPAL